MSTVCSNRSTQLKQFLHGRRYFNPKGLTAISLFSGCGLSDLGYQQAGFRFVSQVEKDPLRAEIGQDNFPKSTWLNVPVEQAQARIVKTLRDDGADLDILIATPPCQGMSSSNPSRGKRTSTKAKRHAEKNRLLLEVSSLAAVLKPRVIVAENVRQILTHRTRYDGRISSIPQALEESLPDYHFFSGVINVAAHGIPQIRRRAIIVGISKDEACIAKLVTSKRLPWPRSTHDESNWVTIRQWCMEMGYESLDSRSQELATGMHPLHFVPVYDAERYALVRAIRKNSGKSAYESDKCPSCGTKEIPSNLAACPKCKLHLYVRPIVLVRGKPRLIKGFKSSYRRMAPDRPASTVTTNSSHVGSDNKIHPYENRVLSILECADLQSIPRWFNWSRAIESQRTYLVRNLIGEAFPPFFTYLHGLLIKSLLKGDRAVYPQLARSDDKTSRPTVAYTR